MSSSSPRPIFRHTCKSCIENSCPSVAALHHLRAWRHGEDRLPPEVLRDLVVRGKFSWNDVESLQEEHVNGFYDCLYPILLSRDPFDKALKATYRTAFIALVHRSKTPPSFLFLDDVKVLDEAPLTGGNFGDLYSGEWREEKVAVKALRIRPGKEQRVLFLLEAAYWQQLDHPNILQLYGICKLDGTYQLISPWMTNGNIIDYLRKETPFAERLRLISEGAAGVQYLHSRDPPLVHGDIKPENMLVDENGHVKLCDFGFTRISGSVAVINSTDGKLEPGYGHTPNYAAPESLQGARSDTAGANTRRSDVFSLGMSMHEILTGNKPLALYDGWAAVTAILNGLRPVRELDDGIPESLWILLTECWDSNDKKRPSIDAIVARLVNAVAKSPPSPISTEQPSERAPVDGMSHSFTQSTQVETPPKRLPEPISEKSSYVNHHHLNEKPGEISQSESDLMIKPLPTPYPNDVPRSQTDESYPRREKSPSKEVITSPPSPDGGCCKCTIM